MDENSLAYGMDVLDEMGKALRPIGLTVEKLDPANAGGIPTGLIRAEGRTDWVVICSVVPTHQGNVSTTFVQLMIPLTGPCPERQAELDAFARRGNEQFLMGTLLATGDGLLMKYLIVLEPTIAMEESHVQAAVFAFFQQAETLARQAEAVCRGEITAEAAFAADRSGEGEPHV